MRRQENCAAPIDLDQIAPETPSYIFIYKPMVYVGSVLYTLCVLKNEKRFCAVNDFQEMFFIDLQAIGDSRLKRESCRKDHSGVWTRLHADTGCCGTPHPIKYRDKKETLEISSQFYNLKNTDLSLLLQQVDSLMIFYYYY